MRRYLQQGSGQLVGWALAILATVVYLLTMEPSVSFWDCGEFIATSYGLEVGHPPGAPLYQLLAHLFTLLAGNDLSRVAWCSNMLSAVAGGMTIAFLYWSLLLLFEWKNKGNDKRNGTQIASATVGALCFLFSDTEWFNVVESEVYGLAMFFAAVLFWAMLRWRRVADTPRSANWLVLIGLLAGLSACVHEMCLLVIPAFLMVYVSERVPIWKAAHGEGKRWQEVLKADLGERKATRSALLAVAFFALGLSTYIIIPIRAQANPPLNEGDASTWASFKFYMNRDQYAKAPLYPRIWRQRPKDAINYADWSGNHAARKGKEMKDCLVDNVQYFVSYQLWYMYGRYLMWNYSGRFNDRQGYGSLQDGQFITGVPLLDKMLVGTNKRPPDSLHMAGHNVYYLIPLLMGIVGLCVQYKRSVLGSWSVLMLFLFGGPILAVYLNMPVYEPRERDYAFVISFYAFAIWIGEGALSILEWSKGKKDWMPRLIGLVLIGVPVLMAAQNWDDHDRHNRYFVRDYARNYLNSCAPNAILFTYGDNDTFPLWYIQEVEGYRKDVQIVNLSLLSADWYERQMDQQLNQKGSDLIEIEPGERLGAYATMSQILIHNDWERPIYFSHYAKDLYKEAFEGKMQVVGFVNRLRPEECDSVAVDDFSRAILEDAISWTSTEGTYIDGTTQRMIDYYWRRVLQLTDNQIARGNQEQAMLVLNKTMDGLPLCSVGDVEIVHRVVEQYGRVGGEKGKEQYEEGRQYLHDILKEQLEYYHSLPPRMQRYVERSLEPRENLWGIVQ